MSIVRTVANGVVPSKKKKTKKVHMSVYRVIMLTGNKFFSLTKTRREKNKVNIIFLAYGTAVNTISI